MNFYRQQLKDTVDELNQKIVNENNKAFILELTDYKSRQNHKYIYEIDCGMGVLSVRVYGKCCAFEVYSQDVQRLSNKKWVKGRRLFKELREIVRYYQELGSYYYSATV
jgi:hypothetical protein